MERPDAASEPRYLNVRETAQRLGVHENTIRNWARDGVLKSARLPGTRFHRFDERDVERLRLQRGAPVSSVQGERRTFGPELADATLLSSWAETREAQGVFPELVRRLLASTPGITNASIRSGEGVAAQGWDGLADSSGTPLLPSGRLCLEFGVGRNPRAKADEDYEKRRDDPTGQAPAESIFVFVTPRRWPGAEDWAAFRRSEGVFADVRVVDADDLEAWLQSTPVAHYWISERLGRRPRHAETLEAWWDRFRSQTAPPLPLELFLAGRENEREKLTEFFGKEPGIIAVQATWRNDAIAFVVAVISSLDDSERVEPPLVVTDADVWARVVKASRGMSLLPLFDGPDLSSIEAQGHFVVLALGREQVARENTLRLPRPHRQAAVEALRAAGVDSDAAYRLGALARRNLQSLVRRLARDPRIARPPWSEEPVSGVLAPLALIGGWTSSENDRGVASKIADTAWNDIERALARWSSTDDPPFMQSGTQWHLASPEEAFLILRDRLTTSDLERWQNIAPDVLLELDPRLDLAPEERPMAGLNGVDRHYSAVLRRGLAQGIALVGSIGDQERLAGAMTGDEYARRLVHDLLGKANEDESGRRWQSLSDVLPLLAEAAPTAFLDAVHEDLDRAQPVLKTMFQDGDESSWLYSSSPHTGLLWALENLCWSPDWLPDAARALARLAAMDPGGRLSNRPLESLSSVLVGWIAHTSAPFSARKEVATLICRELPDVGWQLLFALWPEAHAVASPPHEPRFRDWKPEKRSVLVSEWAEYASHLATLALDLAGDDLERWAEIAENLSPLPPDARKHAIEALEAIAAQDGLEPAGQLILWERLHKETARHRRFPEADWSMDESSLARLEALADQLEPTTNVERFAYLFDWRPDLTDVDPEDYEAYERRLHELRVDAVRQTFEAASISGLATLAGRSNATRQFGAVLGEAAPEELTPQLLEWLDSPDLKLQEAAAGWASMRTHRQGLVWLRGTLARPEAAPDERRVALAVNAPATHETWDLLTEVDGDLVDAYWQRINAWRVPTADVERATHELLARERPWTAIDLLAADRHGQPDEGSSSSPALVEQVLDEALASEPPAGAHSLGYEIGLLLDYLEEERTPSEQIAGYEFFFFRLLEHHRQPRALYNALATDPSTFVDLVQRIYRGKNEPKRQLDERDEALARHAWWVVHHWRGMPGLQDDGKIDGAHLFRWVQEARLALSEADRSDVGDEEIGRVLAISPPGEDQIWPAEPVRELVETIGSTSLETGLYLGVVNKHGTTTRGVYDGGAQERSLAKQYRAWSKASQARWPRTSRFLRRLADSFEWDARRHDEDAEITADTE